MRKLLLVLLLCLAPSITWAQCTGVFQPNSLCGNVGPSAAPPHQITNITSVFGPATTTSGQIPTWLGGTGVQLADPATITTSQNLNLTGQTSALSEAITSATIVNANITSAAVTNLGITSSFLYKGVPYTFPAPITSAITSATAGLPLAITGITTPNFTFNYGAVLTPATSSNFSTTSLTGVMTGYGGVCQLTPKYSSRMMVNFFAVIANSTASDGGKAFIFYGTGAPPAAGTPTTGTSTFAQTGVVNNASTAALIVPFSLTATMSTLTPGTNYWFDLELLSITGGTTTLTNVGCSAMEF